MPFPKEIKEDVLHSWIETIFCKVMFHKKIRKETGLLVVDKIFDLEVTRLQSSILASYQPALYSFLLVDIDQK